MQRRGYRALPVVVALVGMALAGLGAAMYHAELLARDSRIAMLFQDPKVGQATGLIHGEATVASKGEMPPCTASYRRSKSDHFVTVHDGVRISLRDGRTFDVLAGEALEFFDDRAPRGIADGPTAARIRKHLEMSADYDVTIACASPEEPLYLQACSHPHDPAKLAPCSGDDAVYLVPGTSPAPFIASHAAAGAGWLGLGLAGLMLTLATVWWAFAFLRPIVNDLAEHARATARSGEPRDLLGYIFIGVVLAVAIAMLSIRGGSGWYALTMTIVMAGALGVWFLIGIRLRRLSAALRVVLDTTTSRLAEAGDELHELAVRVASGAARVPPLSGTTEPAFVRATISELVVVRGQKSNTVVTLERAQLSHPKWLPIEDASGAASLHMENCLLDASPAPVIITQGAVQLPAWGSAALEKPITPAENHEKFKINWMTLAPGDPLLIYGEVKRVPAGPDHVSPTQSYRQAPIALAVEGKTVAFQGDERELQRGLRLERRAIVPLAAFLLAAIAATVVACISAATQA